MNVFESMTDMEHEQVVFCHDKVTGLKAIIGIHDTTLGPALGGCRIWPYQSEADALFDVLRLSQGMTYKNAAAGLNLGGGKAVILADPKDKTEAMMRAFGRFVESLNGRYITAEDMNSTTQDMMYIRDETEWVAGIPEEVGGSGNPSPVTALGTFEGIRSSVKYKLKKDSLESVTVAVQGLGAVGSMLCEMLHDAGANLIVSDISNERIERCVKQFGAKAVAADAIHKAEVDVFAPCAMGAVINDKTIPELNCQIIAGAANNVLLDNDAHGQKLKDLNILYAPDYIINAGGVINVYYEVVGEYNRETVMEKVKQIYDTLQDVYTIADEENIPTPVASDRFALRRIDLIGRVKRIYI